MTITGPDARSGGPGQAVAGAALLVLERMGLTPADLLAAPAARPPAPTFAEYIPVVSALVSDGCRKAYGSYWNRVTEQWGSRGIDEPTPSEIRQLVQHVRANVVPRRNSRGGRSAAEHLIAALRCLYKHAEEDGLIDPADNPARKVEKPRRLPSTRRAVAGTRLAEINHAAATTGDDPELDTLLLRLHTETACRRGGALALRPQDLDPEQCLILLREKGETVRWQPVSPTLMAALLGHAGERHAPADGQLPHRPPHHLPPLRPPVGPPRPVPALGTGAADQHALDPAHDPDLVQRAPVVGEGVPELVRMDVRLIPGLLGAPLEHPVQAGPGQRAAITGTQPQRRGRRQAVRPARPQVGRQGPGRRRRQRDDAALGEGPGAFQRDHPHERTGDQIRGQVRELQLDQLHPPDSLGQHPDHGVVAGIVEAAGAAAPGDLQQVTDELLRQSGRALLQRRVPVQRCGVGVRMPVRVLQPGEQMPQVTLPGVQPRLPMLSG